MSTFHVDDVAIIQNAAMMTWLNDQEVLIVQPLGVHLCVDAKTGLPEIGYGYMVMCSDGRRRFARPALLRRKLSGIPDAAIDSQSVGGVRP